MKNKLKKKEKHPDFIEMEINGVKMQLKFAEKEEPGIKESIIEILYDSYEKKRLEEMSGEKPGKN